MGLISRLEDEVKSLGILRSIEVVGSILALGSYVGLLWGYFSRDLTIGLLVIVAVVNSAITVITKHNANTEKIKLLTACNWLTNQLDQKTRQLRECRAQLDDYSFMSHGAMKKASETYRLDAILKPKTPEETRLQEIKTMLESYKDIVKED